MDRRTFFRNSLAAGSGLVLARSIAVPGVVTSDALRPIISSGVQSGDVTATGAVVWSRCDRPARIIVEYATSDSFRDLQRVEGGAALEPGDFISRVTLKDLPSGQHIFYRVKFQSLADKKVFSEPVGGSFRTAPSTKRDVLVTWGGDVCGQGWGINPEFGGMKIFESMRRLKPDLFIHSGDTIYADGPIRAEVQLDNGSIWRNLVIPEKSKAAETLDEFRGNYRYNLLDENLRRFNAEVPILAQWDDHEVRNNWYPGQILDDPGYSVKSVDVLVTRARRAFLDYLPVQTDPSDPWRLYRAFNYGPSLEILMLDERSYRGPNSENRQTTISSATDFLGLTQLRWLKRRLLASKATWKIIASDMPIGLVIRDGKSASFESFANGNGPALGRELEIAELLRFIKQNSIKNVVWITADVHYAAAHHYDPSRARFSDFDPFWEFIAGPLNAGTFGPGELDDTFGPLVKFNGCPPGMKPNRSPADGLQFFGAVKIDGMSDVMTASLHNLVGEKLFAIDLEPAT